MAFSCIANVHKRSCWQHVAAWCCGVPLQFCGDSCGCGGEIIDVVKRLNRMLSPKMISHTWHELKSSSYIEIYLTCTDIVVCIGPLFGLSNTQKRTMNNARPDGPIPTRLPRNCQRSSAPSTVLCVCTRKRGQSRGRGAPCLTRWFLL